MLIQLLYVALSVTIAEATEYCPDKCTCWNRARLVKCQSYPTVPDLTALKKSPVSKILIIQGKFNMNDFVITKSNFPRGLKVRELRFKGINRLNINDDAFENLQHTLLNLDLSYIGLVHQGRFKFLKGLIQLENLKLNNIYYDGSWDDFKSRFKGLHLFNLRVLNMFGCGISYMADDALVGLQNLEELDLGGNKLTVVPNTLGILTKLKILRLNGNIIRSLTGARFRRNINLSTLNLANMPKFEIKYDAFLGLENSLVDLNLENTGLQEVPTAALLRLKELKYLNISNNPIEDMETDCLKGKYCLRELRMEGVFTDIHPSLFSGQTDCVQYLSLSGTSGLSVPTEALRTLAKLKYLKYGHNQHMSTLKRDSFSGLTVSTIHLEQLPITLIQKGAFDNVFVPLRLYLEEVSLSNLQFVMDYPKETFELLSVRNISTLDCGCSLVRPVEHLGCALTGECGGEETFSRHNLRKKFLKPALQLQTLHKCT